MIASRRELLLALGVFALLTLLISWPLPTRLYDEIPVSDPPIHAMHQLYALTWSAQTLGDNPFRLFSGTFFYPYTAPIAFLDHMAGLAVMVAPVNWATGNMPMGYNTAWMLTFVLSGLGAYLLTRYLGGSRSGAYLAGVLFMLFPFRFHSAGQINVLAMMWIPFALLSLHLWVETRLRRELFLFLAFSLVQFLSSAYSGVFLIVSSLLYGIVLLVLDRASTGELFRRQRWVVLTVLVLGFAASGPFVLPYMAASRADSSFGVSLSETSRSSAHPIDFVTPGDSALQSLAPWHTSAAHPLFPGIVALALLAYWVIRRGWRGDVRRVELIFYLILVPLALLLALGPALEVGGARIPLPFTAIFYIIPGASFIGVPVRFIVLASLGIAVLAGMGLTLLQRRHRSLRWMGPVAAGLCLLATAELASVPRTLIDPLPSGIPSVYTWLGSVEGDLAIAELPMPGDQSQEKIDHARYQLYSLVHHKRLVNGIAAYVPPLTRNLRRELQKFPDNGSVSRLRHLGVSYVLVHTYAYEPSALEELESRIRSAPGIHVVDMSERIWVLDVIPDPNVGNLNGPPP